MRRRGLGGSVSVAGALVFVLAVLMVAAGIPSILASGTQTSTSTSYVATTTQFTTQTVTTSTGVTAAVSEAPSTPSYYVLWVKQVDPQSRGSFFVLSTPSTLATTPGQVHDLGKGNNQCGGGGNLGNSDKCSPGYIGAGNYTILALSSVPQVYELSMQNGSNFFNSESFNQLNRGYGILPNQVYLLGGITPPVVTSQNGTYTAWVTTSKSSGTTFVGWLHVLKFQTEGQSNEVGDTYDNYTYKGGYSDAPLPSDTTVTQTVTATSTLTSTVQSTTTVTATTQAEAEPPTYVRVDIPLFGLVDPTTMNTYSINPVSVAITPDGSYVVVGGTNGFVAVFALVQRVSSAGLSMVCSPGILLHGRQVTCQVSDDDAGHNGEVVRVSSSGAGTWSSPWTTSGYPQYNNDGECDLSSNTTCTMTFTPSATGLYSITAYGYHLTDNKLSGDGSDCSGTLNGIDCSTPPTIAVNVS